MGIRILVVEDDELIAGSLVRGLREEAFTVEREADGDSAWRALQSGGWDVVILDWWLPAQDGLSIVRRLRERDQETSVLFLTARDSVPDRVKGLNGGADDYLCKPFAFDELLARVHALVRRREGRGGTRLAYADVELDLATQRVARAGKAIDLTAKEYALLVYFLRNADQVLSRTRIYEHVWDERYDGLSNTLEVHVFDLRRRLEAHGARLIHTLRGRGYSFGLPPGTTPGDAP
ncbi:response regulator transcription factor [Paludisphaera mucosa]|uniref:Response regulator transcription factor n=1 Tax=Paludisphaera mucosa TaxID=3030827 RepID=A0ABT6F4Z5_9BACT|nr:response regulator transcription factor [Paludisphaera mucosa]MDG3002594.1 response regulator transcription factor [Paludisphaera mucosa]